MDDKTYRLLSLILAAAIAVGVWWTRHDVSVLTGRVDELSAGHRELISTLIEVQLRSLPPIDNAPALVDDGREETDPSRQPGD